MREEEKNPVAVRGAWAWVSAVLLRRAARVVKDGSNTPQLRARSPSEGLGSERGFGTFTVFG